MRFHFFLQKSISMLILRLKARKVAATRETRFFIEPARNLAINSITQGALAVIGSIVDAGLIQKDRYGRGLILLSRYSPTIVVDSATILS
jgi:hypothetical protein